MRRFFLMLGPLLALSGCAGLLNATVPTAGLHITRNVPYGPLPRQTLDVYAQRSATAPRPLVVFLYGGGWRSGDKGMYLFAAAALARQGMVVVVPDYRLFPQVRYPRFVQDCALATAWAEAHAAGLGADPGRIVLIGHSAGAYNGAMIATDPDWLRAAGGSRGLLDGFVGMAGPYDFLPITDPDVIPIFPHDDPATMPVNHVDGHAPPMLLLAGQADRTVQPRNSFSLARHVRAAGGQAVVKTYPGTAHVGLVLDLTPPFRSRAPVLHDIVAFIRGLPPRPAPAPAAPRSPATPAG